MKKLFATTVYRICLFMEANKEEIIKAVAKDASERIMKTKAIKEAIVGEVVK